MSEYYVYEIILNAVALCKMNIYTCVSVCYPNARDLIENWYMIYHV